MLRTLSLTLALLCTLGTAAGAPAATAAAPASAKKSSLIKPVGLTASPRAAANAVPGKALKAPPVDNSEREHWRHHGVG